MGSSSKNTGMGSHFHLQGIFLTQGSNPGLLHCRQILFHLSHQVKLLSHVQLFVTPWTAAYQAPPSMGFSRQEYWSGWPLPSPMSHQGSPQIVIWRCTFWVMSWQIWKLSRLRWPYNYAYYHWNRKKKENKTLSNKTIARIFGTKFI